jgi:DNA-binding beta-propeller fold protein YncE
MEFEMGSGVAIDAKGIVYLYTRDKDHWAGHPLAKDPKYRGRGSVSMFDRGGAFLGTFAPKEPLLGAHHVFVDREGFIWLVDRDGHQVKKMRPDGSKVFELGRLGEWGNTPDRFNGPTGVAFLPNGDFVVSDGYWNSRIVWFNRDGKFLKSIGSWGTKPGEFGTVHSIAYDGTRSRLLVANLCGGALHPYVTAPRQIVEERTRPVPGCTSRIDMFDAGGKYLGVWPLVKSPLSVAVHGNRIYASEASAKRGSQNLLIVDAATDTVVQTIEDIAIYVHQMAFDEKTGDIYVASVYPEHGGAPRGPGGPSHRKWVK